MLDGHIDTHGPIQDLRAQGIVGNITLDAAIKVKKEELKEAVVVASDSEVFDSAPKSPLGETKKPRKSVKGEHRETGGVAERSIYKSLPLTRGTRRRMTNSP